MAAENFTFVEVFMDITKLSARFCVRRLTPDDAPVVYTLCRENTLYYRYCPPFVTEQRKLLPKSTYSIKE